MAQLIDKRIRTLYEATRSGSTVLYVMSRDQRVADNHALLAAQQYALARKLPLLVAFILQKKTGYRTREHYEFMLTGLRELEKTLHALNIPFIYRIGNHEKEIEHLIDAYKPEAVYFDYNPLRGPQALYKRLASKARCTVRVVDTHNIVPVWQASDKEEFAAHTFRPKRRMARELSHLRPMIFPQPN